MMKKMLHIGRRTLSMFVLAVVAAIVVGCGALDAPRYISFQGAMIGTTYHIKAELPPSSRGGVSGDIEALNSRLISEMSLFDPTSQLSRVNRGESSEITEWMAQNITLADSVSRLSGGIYDITVAPLVKAWGFGAERAQEVPNVDSLLMFVGYEGLAVERGEGGITLRKRDDHMQIDLNSIAKGFAVDRMAEILESYGAVNYLVEIGGELSVRGVNHLNEGWRVGVESPVDGNMSEGELLERRLQFTPGSRLRAMATSGNYRRFYLNDEGEKIVHTIDPRTGESKSSSLLSVTVVAPTCALADAYATMFMAAGDDEAERLAAEIEDCEVYFIYNNARAREENSIYREYLSDKMRRMILNE